jgi:general secretion pathway protein G
MDGRRVLSFRGWGGTIGVRHFRKREQHMTQNSSDGLSAPRNTLAVWALILGIAGLVLSVVVIGGLLGLVALVLGILAVIRPGRKGMAVTGIVTGCLSLLVALVAMSFWLVVILAQGRADAARRGGTITTISNVKTAVGIFEVDVDRYPTTVEGLQALITAPADVRTVWMGPYLEKFPIDAWGHPFVYRCPGTADPTSFDLLSVGPDGIEGTPDDIGKDAVY